MIMAMAIDFNKYDFNTIMVNNIYIYGRVSISDNCKVPTIVPILNSKRNQLAM